MDSTELSRRLTRLEDIEAIRQLMARYAQGADRFNDPKILGPLFTADASWSCDGFGAYTGAEEIARELARIGREAVRWSLHYMVSPLIEVADNGTSAVCHWYLWELARVASAPDQPAQAHWIGGWYDSELVKTAEGWRFSSVTLNLRLLSPQEADWQTLPQ